MPLLDKIIIAQKQKMSFRENALKLLMDAEATILGMGIHYSIIEGNFYSYPVLDYKLQHIIRPMRYALNELGSAYMESSSVRYSIITSGSHLEGCMKALLNRPRKRKPLGFLVKSKKTKKLSNEKFIEDIIELINKAINPAKHEHISYKDLKPLFQFEDALYAHFLARQFGMMILKEAKLA